jgi:hypothetical protein
MVLYRYVPLPVPLSVRICIKIPKHLIKNNLHIVLHIETSLTPIKKIIIVPI